MSRARRWMVWPSGTPVHPRTVSRTRIGPFAVDGPTARRHLDRPEIDLPPSMRREERDRRAVDDAPDAGPQDRGLAHRTRFRGGVEGERLPAVAGMDGVEVGDGVHLAMPDSRLPVAVDPLGEQHVVTTFGPGRDERVDLHPEMELALCRLAGVTGDRRLVAHAQWMIEHTLRRAGLTVGTIAPGGHAVRFLYLASGIAEVAAATGDGRWQAAAQRLWSEIVERHSYCTGAVGGRWMGEAIGRPYELDDDTSYAESCAAVAMAHFTRRVWRLARDAACLDHLDDRDQPAIRRTAAAPPSTPRRLTGPIRRAAPHAFQAVLEMPWGTPTASRAPTRARCRRARPCHSWRDVAAQGS